MSFVVIVTRKEFDRDFSVKLSYDLFRRCNVYSSNQGNQKDLRIGNHQKLLGFVWEAPCLLIHHIHASQVLRLSSYSRYSPPLIVELN